MTTRREREEQVVVEGRVIADFGREFLVELADRRQIVCTRKGKKQDATCGDFVEARLTGSAQGSIERVGTRRNLLYRSDQWREKTLAANVDQVVILLAPRPAYSEAFLNLSLVACEAARIPVIIALNKSDLPEHAQAKKALDLYERIGYTVISMSAKFDPGPLLPHLERNFSLLVGQSGMGKSRTVNALLMNEVARVGDLTYRSTAARTPPPSRACTGSTATPRSSTRRASSPSASSTSPRTRSGKRCASSGRTWEAASSTIART